MYLTFVTITFHAIMNEAASTAPSVSAGWDRGKGQRGKGKGKGRLRAERSFSSFRNRARKIEKRQQHHRRERRRSRGPPMLDYGPKVG